MTRTVHYLLLPFGDGAAAGDVESSLSLADGSASEPSGSSLSISVELSACIREASCIFTVSVSCPPEPESARRVTDSRLASITDTSPLTPLVVNSSDQLAGARFVEA